MSPLDRRLRAELARLRAADLYRTRRLVDGRHGVQLTVDGRPCLNFCSNDYLGLAGDSRVAAAAQRALAACGTGSGAAALISGYNREHRALEEELAAFTRRPRALLFSSGWAANLGVLRALLDKSGTLVADELNHASLIDGGRLSGAQYRRVAHADLAEYARALAEARGDVVLATDSVFSMDGDLAPLGELAALARRHEATLLVDDAHGFGVLGENPTPEQPYGFKGNGVVRHLGIPWDNIVYVSGLSKAYSSLAAFVLIPRKLKSYLKCTVTAYIVSGPVPTATLATALAGLALNDCEGDAWRRILHSYTKYVVDQYRQRGIRTDNDSGFPIVSAYVGSAEAVQRGGQLLFDEGIYVTLQGYPLVPKDMGVLRATPTVANTWDEVHHLVEAMDRTLTTLRKEGLAT